MPRRPPRTPARRSLSFATMRTFCDLSLPVEGTIQSAKIAEMVRTAYRLGYSVVAVNNIVSGPLKPKVHVSERA